MMLKVLFLRPLLHFVDQTPKKYCRNIPRVYFRNISVTFRGHRIATKYLKIMPTLMFTCRNCFLHRSWKDLYPVQEKLPYGFIHEKNNGKGFGQVHPFCHSFVEEPGGSFSPVQGDLAHGDFSNRNSSTWFEYIESDLLDQYPMFCIIIAASTCPLEEEISLISRHITSMPNKDTWHNEPKFNLQYLKAI